LYFEDPRKKQRRSEGERGETVRWRDEERREEEVSGATSPT
jgi:hypothetical protein